MHLFKRLAALMLLAASPAVPLAAPPASAAETDLSRFPFSTEAGVYRDLVVYPEEGREMRLVFPSVTVERPSGTRAILRPGGDGRVIVERMEKRRAGYVAEAALIFGQAPVVMNLTGDRMDARLSLRALALPLLGAPDEATGTVSFEGMLASFSWPTRPSPAIRKVDFAMKAASTRSDAGLAAVGAIGKSAFETGRIDIAGSLDVRMLTLPRPTDNLLRMVLRGRLDRGSVEMLGGRVAAAGSSDFSPDEKPPVRNLRAKVTLDDFATMVQRLMLSGILTPSQVMPLAVLAGSLGTLSPGGTLTFDVAMAPGGGITVNGNPITPPSP